MSDRIPCGESELSNRQCPVSRTHDRRIPRASPRSLRRLPRRAARAGVARPSCAARPGASSSGPAAARPAAGRMAADRYPRLPFRQVRPVRGADCRPKRADSPPGAPVDAPASSWPAARSAVDSRPAHRRTRPGSGGRRACCSAAWTSWSSARRPDRAVPVHPGRRSVLRQVLRAARRLLVGRHVALCAAGRGHRTAAAHALGHVARRRRPGPYARSCSKRAPRRPCWPRRPAAVPTTPACTAGRSRFSSGPGPGCGT